MFKRSIKSSLMVSVILLFSALVFVSTLAQINLLSLTSISKEIGRGSLPVLRLLGDIHLRMNTIRLAHVSETLSMPERQITEIQKNEARDIGTLNTQVNRLRLLIAGNPRQVEALDAFLEQWNLYLPYHAQFAAARTSGNQELWNQLVNVESKIRFEEAVHAIWNCIGLTDQSTEQTIAAGEVESRNFSTLLLIANAFSVLVGLVTLAFVIREVSRPIQRITDSMERIAEGELDTTIPFTERRNELGKMAQALTVFRESLKRNRDIVREKRTLFQLTDWSQSAKSETELYNMIGEVASQLIPDCTGSLYIYANSRDILETAKVWNGEQKITSMHPDDCWGLRRGRSYTYGTNEIEFRCNHVHEEASNFYCCIPILAHGETLGLLHLAYNEGAEDGESAASRFDKCRRLGFHVAEQISMAVANAKLREQLRDQSVRDVLTGLYNRRYLLEAGRRELQRAHRHRHQVSILSIDVDHFKMFNDNHGHDAGDTVLRVVGESLAHLFQDENVACRFGGEEFVVMLPDCTPAEAVDRAEELRSRIESITVRYAENNLPRITISTGIAAYPESGGSLMEVLKVADEALYLAKANGRNRVELSHGLKTQSMLLNEVAAELRSQDQDTKIDIMTTQGPATKKVAARKAPRKKAV
jgi:diguanylate cyclase (GGDEF)-like protein